MNLIPVFLQKDTASEPRKFTTLTEEGLLIFDDDNDCCPLGGAAVTVIKMAYLTISSLLIVVIRLVRSAVFLFSGDFNHAGREFIGAIFTPLVAGFCFAGSLLSVVTCLTTEVIAGRATSTNNYFLYTRVRRIYAHFELWVNNINLQEKGAVDPGQNKPRKRSPPCEFFSKTWTTAPCMQPLSIQGRNADTLGNGLAGKLPQQCFSDTRKRVRAEFNDTGALILTRLST
jgi:hypothetical protein